MSNEPSNLSDKAEWSGPIIDQREFGKRLAERRAALGNPELPRNAGEQRTESKRALLKAIEGLGGKW